MKHKGFYLMLACCLAVLGALVCWLIFGSKMPLPTTGGDGVTVSVNMKNTVLSREQDGKKLWEFKIANAFQDNKNKTVTLEGVFGKVYRKDGSFIDITSDKGSLAMGSNDFVLEGNIKAELKGEGYLTADRIEWQQKTQTITAKGSVVMVKGEVKVSGDQAITTSEFKKLKIKGHAKAEKGGN